MLRLQLTMLVMLPFAAMAQEEPDAKRAGEVDVTAGLAKAGEPELPCGPAAMAIAMQFLGHDVDNPELAALANEDGYSSFATLADYAESKGLQTAAVRLTPGQLLELRQVAILHTRPYFQTEGDPPEHFSVFAGPVDDHQVYVHDPVTGAGPRGPTDVADVAKFWSGKTLIISNEKIDLSYVSNSRRWLWLSLGVLATVVVALQVIKRQTRTQPAAVLLIGMLAAGGWLGTTSATAQETDQAAVAKQPGPQTSPYVEGKLHLTLPKVSKGVKLSQEFVLRNPNKRPIEFRVGLKNCGCLGAEIIGAKRLEPGEQSKLKVDLLSIKGGQVRASLNLHVSTQKEPIAVSVGTTVENDTLLSPNSLDFGEMPIDGKPAVRPIRVVHFGAKGEPFRVEDFKGEAAFLTLAGEPQRETKELPQDVVRTELLFQVACDPSGCDDLKFSESVTLHALAGKQPLEFPIYCVGRIVRTVTARPSRIFKIQRGEPREIACEVTLESAAAAPKVKSIDGDAVKIVKWSQEVVGNSTKTKVKLQVLAQVEKQRSKGTLRLELSAPDGEVIEVPFLLIVAE